jgi:hypothetical protein
MIKEHETSGVRECEVMPVGQKLSETQAVAGFPGFFWVQRGHGQFVQRFPFAGAHETRAFAVNICEVDRKFLDGHPFIGDAPMSVGNVAPGNGHVDLWYTIGYDRDIAYRIMIQAVAA